MKNRINFNKKYKLHYCCDREDSLLPMMQNIFFDKGNAVASDGHILIIAPLEEICNFPIDQKELLDGKFLHRSQYEKILKFDFAEVQEDGIVCKTVSKENSKVVMSETKFLFQMVEKYPDYKKIITDEKESVEQIGLRPNFIIDLSEAAGNKDMIFTFNSPNKAIRVDFEDSNIRGIIMPFMII